MDTLVIWDLLAAAILLIVIRLGLRLSGLTKKRDTVARAMSALRANLGAFRGDSGDYFPPPKITKKALEINFDLLGLKQAQYSGPAKVNQRARDLLAHVAGLAEADGRNKMARWMRAAADNISRDIR